MAEIEKWKYARTGEDGGVKFSYETEGMGKSTLNVRFLEDKSRAEIIISVQRAGRKNPVYGLVYLTKHEVEELYKALTNERSTVSGH